MLRVLTILAAFLFISIPCYAEVYNVEADGYYEMESNDTREVAKKMAVKDAMRNAVEQAKTYIDSSTLAYNGTVTEDDIEAIAAGIIRVNDETFEYLNNGSQCRAHIVGTVDTADVNLQELLETRRKKARIERVPEITSLIVDYTVKGLEISYDHFVDPTEGIAVKAEDGTILYESDSGAKIYYENLNNVMSEAGSAPCVVRPERWIRAGRNNFYYKDPVVKQQTAMKLLAANEIFHFLDDGKVYFLMPRNF